MKYARPVFRAINKVDPKLARATFKEAQDYYHPICSGMIRKVCRPAALSSASGTLSSSAHGGRQSSVKCKVTHIGLCY